MRLAYYAGVSTAAAAACLLKAFHERPNFYSATVYLSQSNACLLILTNLLLLLACSFMFGLQRLLYGPLRPIEIEQLSEKAWYAVLDTLLAMPSFREDVGGWLLVMFTLLLAAKVWGWIGEGKVDVLEQQPPANPRLFHARLATSLLVSVLFDIWMLDYCIETVLADPRPGMMVIFTFEFAVLGVQSIFTFARYLLSVIQSRVEKIQTKKAIDDRKDEIRAERAVARQNETSSGQPAPASPPNDEAIEVDENEIDVPGWEDKRRYLFFLEVMTDFIKLMIYVVFFTVSITFNGLPMHIMRDVYMTFASFSKRVSDFLAYKKATSDMNTRYPDATTEEIRGDSCIVCRENMVAWEQNPAPINGAAQRQAQPAADQSPQAAPGPTPARRRDEGLRAKKLPCGHILHLRCLKAWLERQQVCPTCRRPVVNPRETARAPGQQGGAPAVNGAAPGGQQAAQQAPQRPNRARILNLGPIRIGFLNGPGDQIGNLLRQMQNPQPPAAGQDAAAQAANQQGPNHLGLPVPYLPGTQQTNTATATSTQAQIAQLEQRLVHDAQNLGLEHQQLAIMRSMQQELARLRSLQQSMNGSINASAPAPMIYPTQVPQPYVQGYPHTQHMLPFQQPYMPTPMGTLHGNPTQQFSSGHEGLPPGMTLPEGWTVMPLHRAGVPGVPQASSAPIGDSTTQGANVVTPQNVDSTAGPTNGNGSPLFVPTAPPTNGTTTTTQANPSQPPQPISAPQPEQPSQSPQATESANTTDNTSSENELKTPWQSEGWSFVDPPNGDVSNGEAVEHANGQPPANGAPPETAEPSYEGKGKGKAAAVEDAPDSGT